MDKVYNLKLVEDQVKSCTKCEHLVKSRTNVVFGEGNPYADIMFIGEAPGKEEDTHGRPFIGPAGRLLDNIIKACRWKRDNVYICNVLRCRPPKNRIPTEMECRNCRPYLDKQIEIVNPSYIVCLGTTASQSIVKLPISSARGRFFFYDNRKVLCTYHPSYLLRNEQAKKLVWEDLQLILKDK